MCSTSAVYYIASGLSCRTTIMHRGKGGEGLQMSFYFIFGGVLFKVRVDSHSIECAKHKISISARPSPLCSAAYQIFSSRKVGISFNTSN
jgi:hypothetical protein